MPESNTEQGRSFRTRTSASKKHFSNCDVHLVLLLISWEQLTIKTMPRIAVKFVPRTQPSNTAAMILKNMTLIWTKHSDYMYLTLKKLKVNVGSRPPKQENITQGYEG